MEGIDFYFDLFWMKWNWKPAINDQLSSSLKKY